MGTEGLWIPAVMAAVSAGAQYVNTRNTAKRQDAEAAAGIRAQAERQRAADKVVSDTLAKQSSSNPESFQRASLDQYVQQLRRNRANAEGGLTGEPLSAASDRFVNDTAAAQAGIRQFGNTNADILSRIDAPALQRQAEANTYQRMNTDINTTKNLAGIDQYLNQLRLRGITRNPGLDLFAGLMSAGAGAMSAGAGAGATGSGITMQGAGTIDAGDINRAGPNIYGGAPAVPNLNYMPYFGKVKG